ncbi:APC family permease [Dactylosporangium sp. NPDC049140]|uniref:APC family permease n=1 Tax=Dactylosporangium sp. NPDC049140 TaxID=3155647 RepID=UPI0033CAA03B
MMQPGVLPRVDVVARTLARDRLGVPAVVFFVMSAAAPLTVVAGLVTTGFAVTGVTGIPLAFLVVGAVLALFSVGYVAMARRVANAGAFYAYVTQGLGRPFGVAAAWLALVAYNGLQVALYGLIGAAVKPLLSDWAGINVPWWAVALIAWSVVAVLGMLRVDVNGKVLALLLLAEIAVMVVFDIADLLHPAGGTVTFDTLKPSSLFVSAVGAVFVLGYLGFVGFESSVAFAEECKDPRRTVRVATYISVGLIAGLYALSAWAMSVAAGPDQIVAASREQGPEVVFNLAAAQLGGPAADVGHVLLVTSALAALISFHNLIARYTFALGREHVLPGWLGTTSHSGAPQLGSMLQSTIALTVIIIYVAAGWDPVSHLFFLVGTSGGYGVLLLITTTALAVIVYFARHRTFDTVWRRLVAPTLAAIALLIITALATVKFDVLLNVAADSPLRWVIPAGYVAVALVGVGWAMILKTTRPDVYATIGLGAKAATAGLGLTAPGPRPATDAGWTAGTGVAGGPVR